MEPALASPLPATFTTMTHLVGHSRRRFIRRALAAGIGLPLFSALVAMLRRVGEPNRPQNVVIPPDVATGLSVVESVIVFRDASGAVRAFSARCTHLGCRIDRIAGDEATCPCHGSRFRADGTVASGPAARPLTPLLVVPDPESGGWKARAS